jgi:ABC-type multidrug transport system ATPase subunit
LSKIEDLAEAVMAMLGLSRVADSIVGDVSRRGVSGGERKRVNIGLELMAKPQALFLDEPTSGLDSTSAFLVMGSLKSLAEKQHVSVCCVIHQPRESIFELFDLLILLGVGGRVSDKRMKTEFAVNSSTLTHFHLCVHLNSSFIMDILMMQKSTLGSKTSSFLQEQP